LDDDLFRVVTALDECPILMFLCRKCTCEKLKDIGIYFGIGESGLSQACRRFKDKIRNDKKLERKIAKIEKKLNVSRIRS